MLIDSYYFVIRARLSLCLTIYSIVQFSSAKKHERASSPAFGKQQWAMRAMSIKDLILFVIWKRDTRHSFKRSDYGKASF